MPAQHGAAEPARFAERQNAFKIGGFGRASERSVNNFVAIVLLFFVSHDAIEEGGRRQLLIVANDHDPLGAGDEAERILRAYLARFVDDKQVEPNRSGRQELSH